MKTNKLRGDVTDTLAEKLHHQLLFSCHLDVYMSRIEQGFPAMLYPIGAYGENTRAFQGGLTETLAGYYSLWMTSILDVAK